MIYWDLIKLITTDRLGDAVKILVQVTSSYSGEVNIRYGSSASSQSGHFDRFLRPFHLAWLVSGTAFRALKNKGFGVRS